MRTQPSPAVAQLVAGELHDPHGLLGPHSGPGGTVVTVWRPNAAAVRVVAGGAIAAKLELVHS